MNNSYTLILSKVMIKYHLAMLYQETVLDGMGAREGSVSYRALFESALLIFILT